MTISMSGRLPTGDGNGLVAIEDELTRDPKRLHVGIVLVDGKKSTTDADTGEVTVTARIRRVEIVRNREDARVLERLMRRALDARCGREALPYSMEEEIASVFERLAGETDPDPED